MALTRGFDRSSTGALVTSSAAPSTNTDKVTGWAVNTAGAAHRVNATVSLPAGAVMVRGRAYGPTGAVCYTTTLPAAGSRKYINGVAHHINGAIHAKSAAPGATAIRAGIERLLFDPADGAAFFDSVA
jgi:hypothetical protein